MLEKKKVVQVEFKPRDDGVELENQFIMRFPKEYATIVHEAIQAGNVKDRLSIQLDQDLRYGEVRLDDRLLYSKLVDLPTIVESYKTIDNKSFYKSADICQLLICKEDPEDETEKESPNKNKKKDPNKVDKKYLWPHGITPPCKNVRKRRFRKTLKKKNVEAPEIEKEVKHLLRIDNEAVRVDYELINEEVKPGDEADQPDLKPYNEADETQDDTMHASEKTINESTSQRDINVETDDDETSNFATDRLADPRLAAQEIFGDELSTTDSEGEGGQGNQTRGPRHEMEESSRLSGDDSRMSDFFGGSGAVSRGGDTTGTAKMEHQEFNKSMFGRDTTNSPKLSAAGSSSNLAAPSGFYDSGMGTKRGDEFDAMMEFADDPQPQYSQQQVQEKISLLTRQISDLKAQQAQKSTEIASIQNATLKQRMQETLDNLYTQVIERELELKEFENMLES
ncbi:transcription initiation factor TFIID subunit 7 [Scaptodrosophila lebanonensis]|uniref:Transcription initiation factor TFIID subunit 7 n=1 Tax=Drosophila lebanonensis TaxID=7225 RepID=A0A6J2TCE0_DROLE|nr:transcription initiation factor TFIID subunit 7 [Scaptodrosophila lebanonensis]XP_030374456.1 transcription initiation factor TFIID subunit 7 [Scaptodrosophila lebanonensis]